MNLNGAWSIALSVLATLGGGGAIVFALSSWLGKIFASRIAEREKARHARDLEEAKSELSASAADRERRLKSLMQHYERQVEEFYGPLFNTVHQVFAANRIQRDILNAKDASGAQCLSADAAEVVKDYYQKTYFYPLHDDIIKIIRSKLYLVEGSEIPRSFYEYLAHAAQERDQRTLWKEHRIDTAFLPGQPWPQGFYPDIRKGFEEAMRNYEHCLQGLRGR